MQDYSNLSNEELLQVIQVLEANCTTQKQINLALLTDLKTIKTNIYNLVHILGVVDDKGNIPEQISVGRIVKRVGSIAAQRFLTFGDDSETDLAKIIEVVKAFAPIYTKYEKL